MNWPDIGLVWLPTGPRTKPRRITGIGPSKMYPDEQRVHWTDGQDSGTLSLRSWGKWVRERKARPFNHAYTVAPVRVVE